MHSEEVLVQIAASLRRRAGQHSLPFSTTMIVAACFEGAAVTGRHLPPDVDEAVTVTEDGPLIVYRRGLPTADQRFAIAHAVAHLLFDLDDEANACAVGRAGAVDCEDRADRFAAELLAPLSHVAELVRCWPSADPHEHEAYLDHVDQLASMFHVPSTVIDRRIRQLELVDSV
ncbi:MAG: ImmA/IrrE family metallo-endopeptidase [Kofleriaceae bacterium]